MKLEQEYDINLLNRELMVGRERFPSFSKNLFITVFCLILVGWAGTWGWYALKERGQQAEIARLREQLSLAAEPQQKEQVEVMRKMAAEKDEEVRKIRSSLDSCLEILEQIERSVPQDISLSEISIADGELLCKGTSSDYLVVAEFISNIERQQDITGARCAIAETSGSIVSFEVQAQVTRE